MVGRSSPRADQMAVFLIERSDALESGYRTLEQYIEDRLPYKVVPGRADIDEIINWFNSDESTGKVYHQSRAFYFENQHTAFNFKLRFG
ncbi:MAG: hypothetical protein EOP84_14095 [Verrucomicrobiaceae bacterium]|nr:MAG: hypothetical protein EOP84_14095 [Verrucomicrobiaceae bacterium]